jgi:DNA helicase HerA-like ATPase
MPLPFEIPLEKRFEHHWIVAPPGAGKSTTLQHFIMRDLDLVAANKASIVVMESNRDLIKGIEGLKVFAPGQSLAGKLVLVDAEDVEWPVALNLFDVGMDDSRAYSATDREAFRNGVLAQYEYIFSALLSAEFTSRQSTLFNFTLELLLAIPGATLDTLVDLMGPDGIKNFREYVDTLDPDARKYFELKFNSKDLSKTKDQVLDRLFALKRMRTLSRMFSAPKSKLDFFKEMGSAKVILINAPQSLLQEDGVEIVGRFFISMILLAAQKRQMLPKEKRLPCFVYIDECQDFIKRDPKITMILDQARKFNVGLVLAHQRLQQLQPAVLDALYGATAIKFASKVSDAAAHALARDMRTTPEFIFNQPPYHFAAYVRGLTDTAISIGMPGL